MFLASIAVREVFALHPVTSLEATHCLSRYVVAARALSSLEKTCLAQVFGR